MYIEEEQPTQWPKENKKKDTQWSTKHTYKTKDRVTYKLIYYLVCICSGVSLGNVVMIPEPSLQIVSITNKNLDIKFSAHYRFLDQPSSGTLKSKYWKDK